MAQPTTTGKPTASGGGGRTLRDIRDAQREYAKAVRDKDPTLADTVDGWADHLDDAIARGKELLGD